MDAATFNLDVEASVAKELFLGRILEQNLFPFPGVKAEEKETLAMVIDAIDRFLETHRDEFAEWDNKGEQPQSFIEGLKELGLFGLIIPESYGGIGLSNAGYARVLEQCGFHDTSAALTVGAHSSIGMKGLLLFGTEQQRQRYLPRLASGELISAYCLTESGSGSDAASINTKAEKNADGSWTLNGEKIWITNGGIADFYTVFARTAGPGGKISAFMVERAWPGVASGHKEDKLGIRASSTTTVSFNDVQVPAENLLGAEGKGFKIAMVILNNGRTGLGGGTVGAMKHCIELASKQATERKQFGRSLSEFGLIKGKLARMTVDCFAAESAVRMAAHYIDSGCDDYSVEAAIAKVLASEAMQRTAYEALQIAGGNGFMKEFAYERITRDARILTIFEGTSEILRLYISLSCMKEAGQQLSEIKDAVDDIFNNPIKGFGVLSGYAGKRIGALTTLGRDRIVSDVGGELQDEALIFEKYALELARTTDVLLRRHGRNIVERQFALNRAASVVIDLFVGLCVLSRVGSMPVSDQSEYRQAVQMAKLFSQQAKRRMN